jgi:CheY-like chemotaxis protein
MLEDAVRELVALSCSRMSDESKFFIETQNITLNHSYCSTHADVTPGDYVTLVLSDNGRGYAKNELQVLLSSPLNGGDMSMNQSPLEKCRVFAAMNQGALHVYSEVNNGTTYKIYLPRAIGGRQKDDEEWMESLPNGTETILIAEDDPSLSDICLTVLGQYGYTVLSASNGEQALQIAEEYHDLIHLLITDLIMPNMAGDELYKTIHKIHPETNVLFTSGYTRHALVQQGVMTEKGYFLQKPFSKAGLLWMVRSTLENPQTT